MPPPLDGTLLAWDDVEEEQQWDTLLLGNGLSINVWSKFAYGSLFEYARTAGLTAEDLAAFDNTENFERVLADVNTTIRVAGTVHGLDVTAIQEQYERIQLALGHAIREVHLAKGDMSTTSLLAIREELETYEWVFTTSYDLIIYWAMAADGFSPFMDHFRYAGRCEFDAKRSTVGIDEVPVYFLHGALHIVTGADDKTWKLRGTMFQNLLDQFGQPIAGDPEARPLLVTEGSSRDKLAAIESNDYLSFALRTLGQRDMPLVVFGSSLGPEDEHLVDALNEHDRPVAVSMYPGASKRALASAQADVYARLQRAEPLYFYDSTTHPLGAAALWAGA